MSIIYLLTSKTTSSNSSQITKQEGFGFLKKERERERLEMFVFGSFQFQREKVGSALRHMRRRYIGRSEFTRSEVPTTSHPSTHEPVRLQLPLLPEPGAPSGKHRCPYGDIQQNIRSDSPDRRVACTCTAYTSV